MTNLVAVDILMHHGAPLELPIKNVEKERNMLNRFLYFINLILRNSIFHFVLLLLLITRLLPRDGGMADNHGASEAEQLPRVWTRGRRETESRQRVSAAKSP